MWEACIAARSAVWRQIAEYWLGAGATGFGVHQQERWIACWPSSAPLSGKIVTAPLEADGLPSAELCVSGLASDAGPRLRADAALLAALSRQELDLDALTGELISSQDQLLALYRLTRSMRMSLVPVAVLEETAEQVRQFLQARGAFAILEQEGSAPLYSEITPHAQNAGESDSSHEAPTLGLDYVRTHLDQLHNGGVPLLYSDPAELPTGIANLLILPIAIENPNRAALGIYNKSSAPFNAPDRKLAEVIALQGGMQLENALHHQETVARTRLQTEMDLARDVQVNLLERDFPKVVGLDYAAISHPARQVGGDFYDFVLQDDGSLTFVLGDVSGKGMAAALLMTMTRTAIRTYAYASQTVTPAEILARANANLYDDFTQVSMFATVLVGQYDPTTHILQYANAGHAPVIMCPNDGPARLLEADGPPLGVFPVSMSENASLEIGPLDLFVVASDGFTEAHASDEDAMFGYERLLDLTKSLSNRGSADIVRTICETVQSYASGHLQDDDQTIAVLKRRSGEE